MKEICTASLDKNSTKLEIKEIFCNFRKVLGKPIFAVERD